MDVQAKDAAAAPRSNRRQAATRDRQLLQACAPVTLESSERSRFDSFSATALSDTIDRSLRALSARATLGVSPSALLGLWFDWSLHLAQSPGKQMLLMQKAWRKNARLVRYAMMQAVSEGEIEPFIDPLPQDHRFDHPGWAKAPYNLVYQSFLLSQQWWHNATTGIRGMDERDSFAASFVARQLLDMMSPSNFPWLNPEVLDRVQATGGANFQQGFHNFLQDVERVIGGKGPVGCEAFKPGETVAITPGKVVYRNRVMELIQYQPATQTVRPEPVLVVPAWIMKYYVLDLSPDNSLVKYLVEQGFTVFMISWVNPTPDERDLSLEDYRKLGPMVALDVIEDIVGSSSVHCVGYCLGGTLMSIAAAAMARDGDDRLASLSLFAAQQDFTEAGEILLFIEESEITYLEDMMWEQGFLDARQMAGAFQILRSNDLIWSRFMREYLLGERAELIDLMAWNADTTRMPYKMHSEYLRKLYKDNELASGQYQVEGSPVALKDVTIPIFAVGAERDHVAPWRSAYKIHLLANAETTFVLTDGGHNGGILSGSARQGRHFRIATTAADEVYVAPAAWCNRAELVYGSWWAAWVDWLAARSGEPVDPPSMGLAEAGLPLGDAPGSYVMLA
jgi:polyhydroxyalkanoate synthase subunit PhaC